MTQGLGFNMIKKYLLHTILIASSALISTSVFAYPAEKLSAPLAADLQKAERLKNHSPIRVAISGAPLELKHVTVESRSKNWIQILATPDQIKHLASLKTTRYIRKPYQARSKGIVSEGLAAIKANDLQAKGFLGQGTHVAILDIGFQNYAQARGVEIPQRVNVKNFNATNFELTRHGLAVAEIVHDLAPEAEMTLIAVGTDIEYMEAMEWIYNHEPPFDAVNASIGFDNIGPLNGQSELAIAANKLADVGTLYVNAAGNERDQYYNATFSDTDGDGWHNFAEDDELFALELNKVEPFEVILNWDDWGADASQPQATNDYNIYLWCPDTTEFTIETACNLAESVQAGQSMQFPLEIMQEPSPKGGVYQIGIQKVAGNSNNKLRMFFFNDAGTFGLEYRTPFSTLTLPADGESVLAVGAHHYLDSELDVNTEILASDPLFTFSDWNDDIAPEYFSSAGPTWDGRQKPDLSAPDGVSTSAYGEFGFFGTSAAAPHVTGAALLLKSELPSRDTAELHRLLVATANDVLPEGIDNDHGAGRLNLTEMATKPGLSSRTGIWHNPQQNGHGFSVDRQGNTAAILWYFYDLSGDATWLLAAGEFVDEQLNAEIYTFSGPQIGYQGILSELFDAEGSTVDVTAVGTLTFTFTGKQKATAQINLEGNGYLPKADYHVELEPLLHAEPASNSGQPYVQAINGIWHNPDQNGHGFFISKQGRIKSHDLYLYPTDRMATIWYSYDPNSTAARWWIADGPSKISDSYQSAGDGFGEYPIGKFYLNYSIDETESLDELFSSPHPPVRTTRQGGIEYDGFSSSLLEGYYHFSIYHVELPFEMEPFLFYQP